MKHLKALFLITVLTLLILSSCLLQRRNYIQDYNVSWQNPKHKVWAVEMVGSAKNAIHKKENTEELVSITETGEPVNLLNSRSIDVSPKKAKLIITENLSSYDHAEVKVENSFKNNTQKPVEAEKNSEPASILSYVMMFLGL